MPVLQKAALEAEVAAACALLDHLLPKEGVSSPPPPAAAAACAGCPLQPRQLSLPASAPASPRPPATRTRPLARLLTTQAAPCTRPRIPPSSLATACSQAEAEPDRPAAAVNSFFLEQAKGLVFHWSLRCVWQ